MKAVLAIAGNTYREAIRDRILFVFLGFAIALLASSKLFGLLTVGDQGKIIKDLGLAGIQFFSMLISVMMSVLLISREVERRTVYNILAKPIRRWQFLLGKYLGLVATIGVNLVLMVVVLVAVVYIYQGEFEPGLIFASAMIMLEMVLLASFATLFAVLTKPILGSVLTLAVFFVGHLAEDIWMLTKHLGGPASKVLITALYHMIPNLERFNFKTEVVHGLEVPAAAVVWAVVYALAFTGLVLTLACLRFGSRDLE